MKLDSYGQPNSVSSETSELTIFQIKTIISLHCDVVIAFDNDVSLENIRERDNSVTYEICECICCD